MQFWRALFGRLFGRVPCLRRRVIVNLVDGEAFDAVLFDHAGAWLTLKKATHIGIDGKTMPLDGDVVIECAKVDFIQVLSPRSP